MTSVLKDGLGFKYYYEVSFLLRNKVNLEEKRHLCPDIISKKTLPKSITIASCKSSIINLVKSITYEPAHNGCMHDENSEYLENTMNRAN